MGPSGSHPRCVVVVESTYRLDPRQPTQCELHNQHASTPDWARVRPGLGLAAVNGRTTLGRSADQIKSLLEGVPSEGPFALTFRMDVEGEARARADRFERENAGLRMALEALQRDNMDGMVAARLQTKQAIAGLREQLDLAIQQTMRSRRRTTRLEQQLQDANRRAVEAPKGAGIGLSVLPQMVTAGLARARQQSGMSSAGGASSSSANQLFALMQSVRKGLPHGSGGGGVGSPGTGAPSPRSSAHRRGRDRRSGGGRKRNGKGALKGRGHRYRYRTRQGDDEDEDGNTHEGQAGKAHPPGSAGASPVHSVSSVSDAEFGDSTGSDQSESGSESESDLGGMNRRDTSKDGSVAG